MDKQQKHWQLTSKLICNGVQTLSKAPDKQVEGVYPIYLESADGCYVWDENRRYSKSHSNFTPMYAGFRDMERSGIINFKIAKLNFHSQTTYIRSVK